MKIESLIALLIVGTVAVMVDNYTTPKTPEPVEEYVEKVNPLECKKELLAREYSALKKELREDERTKE